MCTSAETKNHGYVNTKAQMAKLDIDGSQHVLEICTRNCIVSSLAMEAEVLERRTKQRRSSCGYFLLSEWTWQRLMVPVK
jgi:hypothetical protein